MACITRYHSRFSDHTFLKGFAHICVANCALSLHIFVCRCSVFSLVTPRCRRDQKISGPGNSIKPAHYHSSRIRGAMTNSPGIATTFVAVALFSNLNLRRAIFPTLFLFFLCSFVFFFGGKWKKCS